MRIRETFILLTMVAAMLCLLIAPDWILIAMMRLSLLSMAGMGLVIAISERKKSK